MKIYTKTGDSGQTSLLGGKRVSKTNLRVEAYGNVDELNSFIGLLSSFLETTKRRHAELVSASQKDIDVRSRNKFGMTKELSVFSKTLETIQSNLFLIGSYLADSEREYVKEEDLKKLKTDTKELEKEMDTMQEQLPELKNFILPGGTQPAALAHVCRTTARRVERSVVSIFSISSHPESEQNENEESLNKHVLAYLNRLSDFFFVLARYLNFVEGKEDKIWKKIG